MSSLRIHLIPQTEREKEFCDVQCGVMMVPRSSTTEDLNQLMRHFGAGEEISFVFRVGDRMLTGGLEDLLKAEETGENIVAVVYELPGDLPKEKRRITEPEWIRCCAVSPSGNILTGSFDRCIRLYKSAASLVEKSSPIIYKGGTFDSISALCWLDEERFLAGAADGNLSLWHVSNNALPVMKLTGHASTIQSIVRINNETILSADYECNICVFDLLKEAKKVPKQSIPVLEATLTFRGHQDTIAHIAVHKDRQSFYTFGWDGGIKKWSFPDCIVIDEWSSRQSITAAASKDVTVVTGHSDGSLKIWDLNNNGDVTVVRREAHSGWVSGLALHPQDHTKFASIGHDGALQIWDRRDLNKPLKIVREATIKSKLLALSWNNSILAFGGEEKILHIHQ